ncbi:minor tail protein [Haloarcula hispanica tailed virus 2]|uniref:Tail tube n=1 Tax=Haloarcula hispanica tailed virus 2 TaxID=1273751 RepID=R4TG56_9CAUD|nr:minor tail protein [Haloarcula hispanica tailed virus 2]AGM11211.1 tail tube [Haloarcula hispanica tailed virus 2]
MADPYKGEDTQLAVGVESTQGTSVAPTRVLGKVAEEATPPDPEVEWMVTRVIGGTREPFQKHEGQHSYQGGDVPVILQDGAPLAYLLGADSFSSPTHTITAKTDGKPPSQTIEAVYYGRGGGSDFVRTFNGCVPASGELSMNNDDELTLSMSYWAMGVSVGTSPTAGISVPDQDPWLFSDADSQLSLFGSSFARFMDFTLSIENNLEEGRYIVDDASTPSGDAKDPFEITYGNVDYELSATITIEDNSLYNELVNPTDGGFTATMAFSRGNGDTITVTANNCNFTEGAHPIPGESGKVEVEVTMIPESLTITVEDSNSTAAYI